MLQNRIIPFGTGRVSTGWSSDMKFLLQIYCYSVQVPPLKSFGVLISRKFVRKT